MLPSSRYDTTGEQFRAPHAPVGLTMYIEVLYRVRASPLVHLGCQSLTRLDAFHRGYGLFSRITEAEDYDVLDELRAWVLARYRPKNAETKDAVHILLDIAQDDQRAFDLFFAALDGVIASHPDGLKPREKAVRSGEEPLPASGFLDVLAERPWMFLRRKSVGCLRAFLDGYGLAAEEEGYRDCKDLDGFEQWVRQRLRLQGLFRWEDAILTANAGDEAAAFQQALKELKAYRMSKGPLSDRRYRVVVVNERDPGQ